MNTFFVVVAALVVVLVVVPILVGSFLRNVQAFD